MDDMNQKLERVLGSLIDYRIQKRLILVPEGRRKLGQGGYGDVWWGEQTLEIASDEGDGQITTREVAVKTLRQSSLRTKQERTLTACQLARELKVWAGLRHPNILELVGFYLSETLDDAWLISPYEPQGNLAEYLQKETPDGGRKMELIFDALCGLLYLHSHRPKIVHGDLKPANVLIGHDGYAKLCDFGLAKAPDEPTGLTYAVSAQGTPRYMSPELFDDDDAVVTLASDVWAFACVAGEVMTGHAPYHTEKAHHRIVLQITLRKAPIKLDRFSLPTELDAWLRRCWAEEASERPSVPDSVDCLKQHLSATFPDSSRLLQADDPTLAAIPSQTDDFFVELHREKLRKQLLDHPEYATTLTNLAHALTERFEAEKKPDDLDEAITLHRQALGLRPDGHSERQTTLIALGVVLYKRFQISDAAEDLDDMITLFREALDLCPADDYNRALHLSNLATVLFSSAKRSRDRAAFDESINLYREAHQLRDANQTSSDYLPGIRNLALVIQERFENFQNLDDLEETIELRRMALGLCPAGHPDRTTSLIDIGYALTLNANRTLDSSASDESINFYREALDLRPSSHPDHLAGIRDLAWALGGRFDTFGDDEKNLEEAIEARQQALELCPVGHPERSTNLADLAFPLLTRSTTYGDVKDAAASVELRRKNLQLRPLGDPEHHRSLHNLGWTLLMRFELVGEDDNLEEALLFLRESFKLYSLSDPLRKLILGSLGGALRSNFQRHGSPNDLAEAIDLLREAVQLLRVGDFRHAEIVQNLGTALMNGYQSTGEANDIDEAIKFHRQALQLRPERHTYRFDSLLTLGKSLQVRGGAGDLQEAKRLYVEALDLVAGDSPGNLRRQAMAGLLMDEMGVDGNEQSVVVGQVALKMEGITIKDE